MNVLITGIIFEHKNQTMVLKERGSELSYGTQIVQIPKLYGVKEEEGTLVEITLIPQEDISEECPYDIIFRSKVEVKKVEKLPSRMEYNAAPYEFKIIKIEEGENTSQENEIFSTRVIRSQNPLNSGLELKMDNIFIYPF